MRIIHMSGLKSDISIKKNRVCGLLKQPLDEDERWYTVLWMRGETSETAKEESRVDSIHGVNFLSFFFLFFSVVTERSSSCPTPRAEVVDSGKASCCCCCCPLGHAGAVDAGRAHLCQYLVQPLQRPVEVQLYPAGGAGDCLTPGGPTDEERGWGGGSFFFLL